MREILFAVMFCGIPVSMLGMLAAAVLLTFIDLPFAFYSVSAAVPLLCGCAAAGYRCGKRLRSRGMRCGLLSALLLTGFWYAAVCLFSRKLQIPVLLLLCLPCGMSGGVCGVNTQLPIPRRRSHAVFRIPFGLAVSHSARRECRRLIRSERRNAEKKPADSDNCQ